MKHSGSFAIHQGRASVYVAPSKFERPIIKMDPDQARREGDELRQMIAGRRILEPVEGRVS